MAAKPIRIARHVYLKTQQHRLRHVKSLLVRNLTLPDIYSSYDALSVSVYFTLHSTHNPDKVLYKSEPLQETYNPSWESVQFTPGQFEKHAALPTFMLKLWVRFGSTEEEYRLAHKRVVELFDLAYLGPFVNKDGSGYPPNSVIVGMFEGYYSHPGVGGVPCPPRVTHSLGDLLPPQSLLEVQKSEVLDSYYHPVLMRILNRQEVLNRVKVEACKGKREMERYMEVERAYFSKTQEREDLRTRLEVLRLQLAEQKKMEREEREHLSQVKEEVDTIEGDLRARQKDLSRRKAKFESNCLELSKKKDQLDRETRNQQLRQRNMVCELARTFFIKAVNNKHTICNVVLPNADVMLEQPSSVDHLGVALGYVAHLVHQLSRVLLIPLQYQVKPYGSRSFICDHISDEALIDNIKEFPLFLKGSEKALFQYAVYLLNKDIAQMRQNCGHGTSRSMFRKTLPNLKLLLDRLTKDVAQDGFSLRMPIPIDTASLYSYVPSLSDASTASSTIIPFTPSPGSESYRSTSNSMSLNPASSLQSISPDQSFPVGLFHNESSLYGERGLNLHDFDATNAQYQPTHPPSVNACGKGFHLDPELTQTTGGRGVCESNPKDLFSSGHEQYHSSHVTKSSVFTNEDQFSDPVCHTGNSDEESSHVDRQSDSENKPSNLDNTTEESSVDTSRSHNKTTFDADKQPEPENKSLSSGNTAEESFVETLKFRNDTTASDSSRHTDDTLFASASPQDLQSTPVPQHIETELDDDSPNHDAVSRFPQIAFQRAESPATIEGTLIDSATVPKNRYHNSNTRHMHVPMYAPYTYSAVGEGGFIKTDVATPHIVSSRAASQRGGESTQKFSASVHTYQHSASSPAHSSAGDDTQFLEDFIDGPT